MAEVKGNGRGEGLSLQTLVVAAAASAVAAIVVSHVWNGGTVIAAAMTPVIVTIVKELLTRPMESELVRKPVQQVGRLASGRLVVPGRAGAHASGEARVLPPMEDQSAEPMNGGGPPRAEDELTPIRTYRAPRRRPIHLKIALVTGLIAFVIAAAALTLPELIFGSAISSHHSTTLFGGGGGGGSKKGKNQNDNGSSTTPQQSQQQRGQTAPATPPTAGGSTKPSPGSQQSTSPQQTTPQQTTPLPTTPTTPAP
jgi:uncharacterized membrane protein YvlD (DUF360 family)